MIDPGKAVKQSTEKPAPPVAAAPKLMAGVLFGLAFGFLLQKGGVGNSTCSSANCCSRTSPSRRIMLTAIVVGMIGIFTLHHFAKVNLHLKPTRIGSNIIGGLLFGAGFALMGYCPGTAAAALGQGSWDALFGMAGLVAGSWIFAELSGGLKSERSRSGAISEKFCCRICCTSRAGCSWCFALLLTVGLFALERAFPR
jgi:uncharacterized protein